MPLALFPGGNSPSLRIMPIDSIKFNSRRLGENHLAELNA